LLFDLTDDDFGDIGVTADGGPEDADTIKGLGMISAFLECKPSISCFFKISLRFIVPPPFQHHEYGKSSIPSTKEERRPERRQFQQGP